MKQALVGRKKSAKISARFQLFYKCCNKTVNLVFWNFAKHLIVRAEMQQ